MRALTPEQRAVIFMLYMVMATQHDLEKMGLALPWQVVFGLLYFKAR